MNDTGIRLLSAGDIATIDVSPAEVVSVVEAAYQALAEGKSANPRKLTVKPDDGHSVAYAMLGRDGALDTVAIKTSYKFDPDHDRATQHYYTSLMLYDDVTGLPIALMDCGRVGSLRTPAVSALIARECAPPDARTVLSIGTGTQGRQALPFLLTSQPQLERLLVFGTHPDGLHAVREELGRHYPGREIEVVDAVDDLPAAAAAADIVLAVAGPGTPAAVEASWLGPGTLCILVGHGIAPSTLHEADRVIATSAAQMAVTGTDMADDQGRLPVVDGELPEVLVGRIRGRERAEQRIFAYNSGLVITDIALGHRFAVAAAEAGLGQVVSLWG